VFLVGAAFQVTGQVPVNERAQIQKDYSLRDLERSARYYGVPFELPAEFPYPLFAACRAFYWLQERDPALAKALSHAVYAANFGQGRDMRPAEAVAEVAAPLGVDGAELVAAVQAPAWKERFKTETEAALRRGVFGSPFFIVGEEKFWGADRMAMLEWWLEQGA